MEFKNREASLIRLPKIVVWGGVLGLVLLLIGHFTAIYISDSQDLYSLLNHTHHTPESIWIRIFSIPLRFFLVVAIGIYLHGKFERYPTSDVIDSTYILFWCLLCLYYCVDLELSGTHLHFGLHICCVVLILWILASYINKLSKYLGILCILLLTTYVLIAQRNQGENNAFTLFGLIGISFIGASFFPAHKDRFIHFGAIIPALGYLFPVLEKLMLNPVGWISGKTMMAYGQIYGYELSNLEALLLSLGLVGFQLSSFFILLHPRIGLFIYPLAILFHLLAGVLLGFSPALNPWITTLLISITLLFQNKSSNFSSKST